MLDFLHKYDHVADANPLLQFTYEQEYLLANSDILSVSVPSLKETNKMINKQFLSSMKKNSLLINTSRGSIVDEEDLLVHLQANPDSFWYAADVFMNEPSKSKDHFDHLIA